MQAAYNQSDVDQRMATDNIEGADDVLGKGSRQARKEAKQEMSRHSV